MFLLRLLAALLACLLVGGAAVYVGSIRNDEPVSDQDRAALLTASDLLAAAGSPATVDESAATITRQRGLNGNVQLTYEIRTATPPLHVITDVRVDRTPRAAIGHYESFNGANRAAIRLSGDSHTLTDQAGVFTWGDASQSSLLTIDGVPSGNFVIARKGTRVYSVSFTGVTFDQPGALNELLDAKLEAMMALEP